MDKYQNRKEAGKILAGYLDSYADRDDVIVLGLPRGGVPVAYEVAKALKVPLDVFIVRKIGVPGHSELAMGAMASGNVYVFNEEIIQALGISKSAIDRVIAKEAQELARRESSYRDNTPFPVLKDKIVILVDDGIATGATMRVAIKALLTFKPKKLVIAVPVAQKDLCDSFAELVDEFISPLRPENLQAVGIWYDDFSQTEDEEVFALLNAAKGKEI